MPNPGKPKATATTAVAYPAITKGNQLLSLKAYNELSAEDQQGYDEAAIAFIDSFNDKYPSGKVVKAEIERIIAGEKITFVMKGHSDLSTKAYSFPYEVVDIMAANVGAGSTDGLLALAHASLEPLYLTLTVVGVKEGDEYQAGDETRYYKCASMVKAAGTREEVVLSDDAADLLGEIQKEVLRDSIKAAAEANRSKRRGSRPQAAVVTAAPVEEEADV